MADRYIEIPTRINEAILETLDEVSEETLQHVLGPAESRDKDQEAKLRKVLSEEAYDTLQDFPFKYFLN